MVKRAAALQGMVQECRNELRSYSMLESLVPKASVRIVAAASPGPIGNLRGRYAGCSEMIGLETEAEALAGGRGIARASSDR